MISMQICGVVISGSRCRGLEGKHSDLDVVVERISVTKEDDMFNLLHEDKFSIGGVKVDINPITECRTGTLEEYLPCEESIWRKNVRRCLSEKKLKEKKTAVQENDEKVEKGVKKKIENQR